MVGIESLVNHFLLRQPCIPRNDAEVFILINNKEILLLVNALYHWICHSRLQNEVRDAQKGFIITHIAICVNDRENVMTVPNSFTIGGERCFQDPSAIYELFCGSIIFRNLKMFFTKSVDINQLILDSQIILNYYIT